MITQETRLDTYFKAPQKIQELYGSSESTLLNKKIKNQFTLQEDKFTLFLELTGDVILGFYKTTDLPVLFQSQLDISSEQALQITSELIEFLSPVVEREQTESNTPQEQVPATTPQEQPLQAAMPAQERAEVFRAMAGEGAPARESELNVVPVAKATVAQPPLTPATPIVTTVPMTSVAQSIPVQVPVVQQTQQSVPVATQQPPVVEAVPMQQPATVPAQSVTQPITQVQSPVTQTPENLPTQQSPQVQSFIPTHIPQQPTVPLQPTQQKLVENIDRVHGYGTFRGQQPDIAGAQAHTEEIIRSASQDDLLQRQPRLAPMPTYNETASSVDPLQGPTSEPTV